jgi:F-type H+-transporting ATPase subunit b
MQMRWLLALVLGTALFFSDLTVGRAVAAEEGGQKSIFDIRFDLGLWTIIVFLALFFILKKFAWGPILEGLQKREQTIRGALSEAHRAQEEARSIRSELQKQLNQAGDRVREIIDAGRRDAEQVKDDLVSKARTEIQAERERLRKEIDLARDQALHELWNQSAQLATLISAKAIRRQLSEADHRHLVDEALSELRQAGTAWQQGSGGLRL